MIPIGFERRLDLDKERDFDRDLQTEFPLAKEVADHLAKDAKSATSAVQELSEVAWCFLLVDCGHRGDRWQTG